MDPMSGFDIRLVFTLPPRDSTLQYKRCVHLWNDFSCITTLVNPIYLSIFLKENNNNNKNKNSKKEGKDSLNH